MPRIDIRDLTPGDVDLVSGLEQEFPARDLGWSASEDTEEFAEVLPKLIQLGAIALAAVVNGETVGYGLIVPRLNTTGADRASDAAVLSHVAVQLPHRRSGVGAALLEALTDSARRRGTSLLYAHVPAELQRFYEAAGWTVTAPREGLAWVEEASTRQWEEFHVQGAPIGARRRVSMLRSDDAEDDAEYPSMAYVVLAPRKIDLLFEYPWTSESSMIRPYIRLAQMCLEEEGIFAALSADVSQTVEPFILRLGGPGGLGRLKRSRHG